MSRDEENADIVLTIKIDEKQSINVTPKRAQKLYEELKQLFDHRPARLKWPISRKIPTDEFVPWESPFRYKTWPWPWPDTPNITFSSAKSNEAIR